MREPASVAEWPVTVLHHQSGAWEGFRAYALRVRPDRTSDFTRRLAVHSLFLNLGARPIAMRSRVIDGPSRPTPLLGHAWTLVPAGMTLVGVAQQGAAFEHFSLEFADAHWREALADAGLDDGATHLLPRLGATDPIVAETARRLRRALQLDGSIGRLYGAQLGALLMTEFAIHHASHSMARAPSRGGLAPPALRRVLDALGDATHTPDAATLVALTGLSRGHFFRAFRASTGTTPERYLTEQRIARACSILARNPELSDAAVARAAHFASGRHLRSAFRRVTGRTLTTFRRELG